jgi:hypothetical protein
MENFTFIPDLCGMSLALDRNIMPGYVLNAAGRELGLDFCKLYHRPYHNTVMWKYEYLNKELKTEAFPDNTFKRDFFKLALQNPMAYLESRFALTLYMTGIKRSVFYQPFLFEIQQFPESHYLYKTAHNLSLKNISVVAHAKNIAHYLYENTILYQVWLYLLLSIIQISICLPFRPFSRNSKRALLLLFAGLFYWLPYLLISPSAEFRFSSFTVFCSILAVPLTTSHILAIWRARQGRKTNLVQ